MIIIQVMGGLGNQLQQYALYEKLKACGKDVKLDVSWFHSMQPAVTGNKNKTEEGFSADTDRKMSDSECDCLTDDNQKNSAAVKRQTSGNAKEDDVASFNSEKPGITRRNLELAYFPHTDFEICTEAEKTALIGNDGLAGKFRRRLLPGTVHWFHESKMYHPEIFDFTEMYVSGYFACEKYYADILPQLREKLRFPESSNPQNAVLAERMAAGNSVSVHIRRGDYLNPENQAMFGGICTEAYYESAIKEMRRQVPDAHFYIFSDDIPYAAEHYGSEDFTIVDINHGADSFFDMWLMSQCKHNICANSTFSFWGARLNENPEKIMIRPTIHKNSQTFVKETMTELWAGWQFVSPSGAVM